MSSRKLPTALWQPTNAVGEIGFAVAVLIACVYTISSLTNTKDYLLNADALYIPTLISDFRKDINNLFGWRFPPASHFFPDFVLFLPMVALSADPLTQIQSFSVLQFV